MIAKYICPTCGHEAVWHIWMTGTLGRNLCENCWGKYSQRYSRIVYWDLHREERVKWIGKIGRRWFRTHAI